MIELTEQEARVVGLVIIALAIIALVVMVRNSALSYERYWLMERVYYLESAAHVRTNSGRTQEPSE